MKTSDALAILDRRDGDDENIRQLVEAASLNRRVAELIHNARVEAGLSQNQLAELLETGQSSIARLEDADYRGHSLTMLRRVAQTLGYRLRIEFERIEQQPLKKEAMARKVVRKVVQRV